jgi:undecaprenyl-diphosphatase
VNATPIRMHARRRAAFATAVFAASLLPLRRGTVGPRERQLFCAVNRLPDALFAPAWLTMQLGTLAAVPVAAGVARAAGERRLARRLLVGGVAVWAASKLVKRMTRRPRPALLLPETHVRGREAAGLGYPSGHAGVAVALGIAAWPHLDPRARWVVGAVAPLVGVTRIYVGAHLPLDVVSGAALGVAIEAAVASWL